MLKFQIDLMINHHQMQFDPKQKLRANLNMPEIPSKQGKSVTFVKLLSEKKTFINI